MDDLSLLQDRIGGFQEIVKALAWPPTQVHNRYRRERERSDIWVPGDLPRPFMRIAASPLFDMEEIYRYIASPAFKAHSPYPGTIPLVK